MQPIDSRFNGKILPLKFFVFNPNSKYIHTGTRLNENKSNDADAKWIYISKIPLANEKNSSSSDPHWTLCRRYQGGDLLHEILSNTNF